MKVLVILAIFAILLIGTALQSAAQYDFIVVGGETQTKQASSKFPLYVQVVDEDNSTVSGVNVTFCSNYGSQPTSAQVVFTGEVLDENLCTIALTNSSGWVVGNTSTGFNAGQSSVVISAGSSLVTVTFNITKIVYVIGWVAIGVIILFACLHILGSFGLAAWILTRDNGTKEMREISDPIREGAQGFFKVQYLAIALLALPVSVIIFGLYMLRGSSGSGIPNYASAIIISISFVIGATCSGLAGLTGMWVAVRANIRVAAAARSSYNGAVSIALRSGAFAGFLVVSLSVLGVCCLFALLYAVIPSDKSGPQQIPLLLVGYGFGASFVALFAQLGGGIYTKAADVGADIIGKVEANIPEDDVRNPAVVADLVGDNVGDCAGRGADLFESIAAENIGAMVLAGTLAYNAAPQIADPIAYMVFPLSVHVFGLIASWVGVFVVRVPEPKKNEEEKTGLLEGNVNASSDDYERKEHAKATIDSASLADPMNALNRGYFVTVVIATIFFVGLCFGLLHDHNYPNAWWLYAICGLIGIVTSWAFVFITIYYTDFKWWPVKRIAEASRTGAGTNVIAGIAVGLESTCAPVITISIAILSAYAIGNFTGIKDNTGTSIGGLFGTAVATIGMLASAGFILAMDTFGPITDNAGGIVEMSQLPPNVRVITDRLDAVGNTTKALTKGYAIGSASLAAFLLFRAYLDEITSYLGAPFYTVDLSVPEVFIGALLGAMLVFIFSSLAIRAVGKSAQALIVEVRRQFAEKPGIMTYEEKPDYQRCVSMVARSALIQMILPGLLPVLSPICIGLLFRLVGMLSKPQNDTLGAEVAAGFLMVATIAGVLMALFLNNGGGAWDNAKKFIEMGNYGGKGSDTHKAAVIGDTVGDPFKDTAGPSLHVLIKLLATISLVVGPLFINQKVF